MFSIEECRRMFLFCIGGGLLLEWLERYLLVLVVGFGNLWKRRG